MTVLRNGAQQFEPLITRELSGLRPPYVCQVRKPVEDGLLLSGEHPRGQSADWPAVAAWADDYIHFERLPDWQKSLRNEIRTAAQQLKPMAGQVLHATLYGPKPANADVENLLLYNIDSFRVAGAQGIRFELGDIAPSAPGEGAYRFHYRYALAPASGPFLQWRQGRTLASFEWTGLGTFAGEKKLAQVWLALKRGQAQALAPTGVQAPFAVKLEVRPPHGRQPVWGGLLKGIFDGVICAFQAQADMSALPETVARLAAVLPARRAEIETLLLDRRLAVLGTVPRLVSPYRRGVKWDPADHLCVAGELLAVDPVDSLWAIRGEIVELSR